MSDETVFFAFAGGRKLGPLTGAELEALAHRGEVGPDDLVWKSGTPEWLKAAEYVVFEAPFPEAEEELLLEASGIRPLPRSSEERPGEVAPRPSPPPPAAPAPARLAGFVEDLRSFTAAEVFPVSRLADPRALGSPSTWGLLVFGVGLLSLGTIVEDPVLRVRLLHLACGALWTSFLALAFRPAQPSPRLGVAVFASTLLLGALLVSLLPGVPPLSWLASLEEPGRSFPVRLLAGILGTGLVAEAGKALLLLVLARRIGGVSGPAEGVTYGLLAGLGFGVWEAVATTSWGKPGAVLGLTFTTGSLSAGLHAWFVSSLVRTASLPLLHAAWSGVAGYFVGLSFRAPRKTPALLVAGLALASLLHGTCATLLAGDSGFAALLVATLSLLLLVAYRTAALRTSAEGGNPEAEEP